MLSDHSDPYKAFGRLWWHKMASLGVEDTQPERTLDRILSQMKDVKVSAPEGHVERFIEVVEIYRSEDEARRLKFKTFSTEYKQTMASRNSLIKSIRERQDLLDNYKLDPTSDRRLAAKKELRDLMEKLQKNGTEAPVVDALSHERVPGKCCRLAKVHARLRG